MLVGILAGDSLAHYYNLVKTAPAQCQSPLVVYLTSPEERVSPEFLAMIESEEELVLGMRASLFRHLFNPDNKQTGYCTALLPLDLNGQTVADFRLAMFHLDPATFNEGFMPYAELMPDGMRSDSTRAFCRSLGDVLPNYSPLEFLVFWADPLNEEHHVLFERFNAAAQDEFTSADAMGSLMNFGDGS